MKAGSTHSSGSGPSGSKKSKKSVIGKKTKASEEKAITKKTSVDGPPKKTIALASKLSTKAPTIKKDKEKDKPKKSSKSDIGTLKESKKTKKTKDVKDAKEPKTDVVDRKIYTREGKDDSETQTPTPIRQFADMKLRKPISTIAASMTGADDLKAKPSMKAAGTKKIKASVKDKDKDPEKRKSKTKLKTKILPAATATLSTIKRKLSSTKKVKAPKGPVPPISVTANRLPTTTDD